MADSKSLFARLMDRLALPLSLTGLIFLFLILFFFHRIFISIDPGHVGVKWLRLAGGTDVKTIYGEGLHIVMPWDRMEVLDVRLQTQVYTFNVLTSDGLEIDITVSVRYRLNSEKTGLLYKNVGSKYVDVLLKPEVEAHARLIFAQYDSEQIYSDERQKIQSELRQEVIDEIEVRYKEDSSIEPFMYIQDVLVESVILPDYLSAEIEKKLAQKHLMLSYEYRLRREKLESQRKEVEALGIRKFQDIVGDGITDRYLRWKGIDATLALASSNNSKVVVIGAGDEGLPLILGNMGGNTPVSNQSSVRPTTLEGQNFQKLLDSVTTTPENSILFNNNKSDEQIPETGGSAGTMTDKLSSKITDKKAAKGTTPDNKPLQK